MCAVNLASQRGLAVQIVVLGKSLGGAVALHLAAANPKTFKAVVVENTFLSIEDVAPKVSSPSTWHRNWHSMLVAVWLIYGVYGIA